MSWQSNNLYKFNNTKTIAVYAHVINKCYIENAGFFLVIVPGNTVFGLLVQNNNIISNIQLLYGIYYYICYSND